MNEESPTFHWPVRIYYEDTDASGVVYHAQYLKYFERARTEWLRSIGFGQQQLNEELRVAFTVVSANVEYVRPARLDDAVQVSVTLAASRRASLIFDQILYRDDTVLARGRFRIACVDTAGFRPRAIPERISKEIA